MILRVKRLAQELTRLPNNEIPLEDFVVEVRVTDETPWQASVRWKKYDALVASGEGDDLFNACDACEVDLKIRIANKGTQSR